MGRTEISMCVSAHCMLLTLSTFSFNFWIDDLMDKLWTPAPCAVTYFILLHFILDSMSYLPIKIENFVLSC